MTKQKTQLQGIRFRSHCQRWEARVSIQGTKYDKTFKTLDEACKYRQSLLESKNSECHLTCDKQFSAWIEKLQSIAKLRTSTIRKYKHCVKNYYLKFFGKLKIKDISDKDMMNFIIELNEVHALTTETIKDYISALTRFFDYCCLKFDISFNPAKSEQFKRKMKDYLESYGRDLPKYDRTPTVTDVHKLLDAAFEHGYEFGVATVFFFTTGMRLGEVAALTWSDFVENDEENQMICLINKTFDSKDKMLTKQAKSGSNGYIGIPPTLMMHLNHLKAQQFEDTVFPFLRRNPDGFTRILGKLSEVHCGRRFTAHKLRRAFVTYLAKKGVNTVVVQKAVRHSSAKMTEHYLESSHLGLEEIPVAMENFLGSVKAIQGSVPI